MEERLVPFLAHWKRLYAKVSFTHACLLTLFPPATNPLLDYGPFLPGMGPDCAGPLVRFNQIQDLQDALEKSGPKIAAFIVEVVQGHSGCIPSRDGFIEAAFRLCKQHNVLFVVDEVQCGLGRAGFLRTYAPHNAKPDLVVLGKALTGGAYPLSVVLGTEEVMGQMLPGE